MNIVKYLPYPVKLVVRTLLHFAGRYSRRAYSQEGEDLLLARLIDNKREGFYVDVGAHHPSRCSNTYYFYRKGWRGINIDAMPGSMGPFKIARPRDINLEMAVSDKKGVTTFHSFREPLFNTADPEVAESRRCNFKEDENRSNVHRVQVDTLASILDKFLPSGTTIDFLSIDVEGLDLKVLQSNDWSRFRPKYVLVEILGETVLSLQSTDAFKFLIDNGYDPVSKLVHTVVFREKTMGKIFHY